MNIKQEYEKWLKNATIDKDLINELNSVKNDENKINDAFYRHLEFGTAGLRGVIGAGTNRMNVYTVARASKGLANYLNNYVKDANKSVAISYDSRIKSTLFAEVAASTLANAGIKVFIYKELMPVPNLSYAVRELKCTAGIMITASHNPSKYNGYKVYGSDGCQITDEMANLTLSEINKLDYFGNEIGSFKELMKNGMIEYIPDSIFDSFIEEVKNQSVLFGDEVNRNVSIVYSPLNGAGLKPVTRVLKETGFTNVTLVKEQEKPDGNFPTCPYPNPEIRQAMSLGMEYAKKNDADLLIATDPDCDRVGIAVKNKEGEFVLFTGNQTGLLLLDFIASQRTKHNKMPGDPITVKTIVTSDMIELIAKNYNVTVKNVLTGFKYIGETILNLEKINKRNSYIFGFEESYGYLTGTYVRDKDAVDGAFMICEMFAYYKTRSVSLIDKLNELYEKYGYFLNTLHTYEFEGIEGFEKMKNIMSSFRNGLNNIAGTKIEKCLDYEQGIDGLPKANVLKYYLVDGSTVVVRPSGTEPKLKLYVSIKSKDETSAREKEKLFTESLNSYFN